MKWGGVAFFVGYIVLFLALVLGVAWWDHWRKRTRHPLPENVKLLRMPGEHLWRRVAATDENDVQWLLGASVAPLLGGTLVLQLLARLFPKSAGLVLGASLAIFVILVVVAIRFLDGRLQRRADDYLGFFGERYVAEWLDPMKADGWFIFHDIRFDGATGKFNLDHVALGPGGIWVVETKTHRKRKARPGRKEHEVEFDGKQIIWPRWDETESIDEAANNAQSLREWLQNRLGKKLEVWSVVAIPGYFVTERKLGPVRIANPKVLPQVLMSHGRAVLSPSDIDLIRRQLEDKCRDVEY